MPERRYHFRIPVNQRGLMTLDGMTTPCDILDLTEQGLQLQTCIPLKAGDSVQIECNVGAEHLVRSTIKIIHAEGLRAGGLMANISTNSYRRLKHFLATKTPPRPLP